MILLKPFCYSRCCTGVNSVKTLSSSPVKNFSEQKMGPPETLDGKKEFVDDMVYGWVYKTAEELSSETMLNLAPNTIRRHLKELVEKGYLLERSNPKYKWDRTLQYRVDLLKVQTDLMALGYPLEGYSVELPIAKMEHGASVCGDSASHVTPMEFPSSKMENQSTEMENQICENGRAIPEITTENYNREKPLCVASSAHWGSRRARTCSGRHGLRASSIEEGEMQDLAY